MTSKNRYDQLTNLHRWLEIHFLKLRRRQRHTYLSSHLRTSLQLWSIVCFCILAIGIGIAWYHIEILIIYCYFSIFALSTFYAFGRGLLERRLKESTWKQNKITGNCILFSYYLYRERGSFGSFLQASKRRIASSHHQGLLDSLLQYGSNHLLWSADCDMMWR